MKVICIFSADETTEFLRPIYDSLSKMSVFIGIEIKTDEKVVRDTFSIITDCDDNDCIIFLGHGASNCLYNIERTPFIGAKEFQIFENKRIFLFACRTADFIKRNKHVIPKEYIGFGDLPTEWSEVVTAREADTNAYLGMTEEIINDYKRILSEIISKSLVKAIGSSENYYSLYRWIKLAFNKKIGNLLTEKTYSGYRILANLLYETKTEMVFGYQ